MQGRRFSSRYHPDYHAMRGISCAHNAGMRPGHPGKAQEWLSDKGYRVLQQMTPLWNIPRFRLVPSKLVSI